MSSFSPPLSHSAVWSPDCCNPVLSCQFPPSSIRPNCRNLVTHRSVLNWNSKLKIQSSYAKRFQPMLAMYKGGKYNGSRDHDEYNVEPFWLDFCKETIRALKSVLAFLVEQPAQLKYIEWPSFKDTLRTASLTLVLVAMLIVALSSIDSALSFTLALLLRRPA